MKETFRFSSFSNFFILQHNDQGFTDQSLKGCLNNFLESPAIIRYKKVLKSLLQ